MSRLHSTAVHEAGHAVVTLCERQTFSRVVLEPSDGSVGAVHDTRVRIHSDEQVRIKLAGAVAERLCCRVWHPRLASGAEDDLMGVGAFFREQERHQVLIDWNIGATRDRLLEHWTAVERVARALWRRKRLEYAEVLDIWSTASSLPVSSPPGQSSDGMWTPLRQRIDWHIANPGGIEATLERLIATSGP